MSVVLTARASERSVILLATDGGAAAAHALEVAIEIARGSAASLVVISVHACAGVPIREADVLAGPERIAGAAAARARRAGLRASAQAAHGDVVRCIANAARTLDADLIVVGSHGLGSPRRDELGSVSQALVCHSPVSVTVVHETTVARSEASPPVRTPRLRGTTNEGARQH